jgi:hypothetical protein
VLKERRQAQKVHEEANWHEWWSEQLLAKLLKLLSDHERPSSSSHLPGYEIALTAASVKAERTTLRQPSDLGQRSTGSAMCDGSAGRNDGGNPLRKVVFVKVRKNK